MSTHKDQCFCKYGKHFPPRKFSTCPNLCFEILGNTSRCVCFHESLRYSEQSLSLPTISPIEWSSRKYITLSIIQKIGILAHSFLWIPSLLHQDLSSPLVSWFNLRQVWQSCADILIVMPGWKEKSGPINAMKKWPWLFRVNRDEILPTYVGFFS